MHRDTSFMFSFFLCCRNCLCLLFFLEEFIGISRTMAIGAGLFARR